MYCHGLQLYLHSINTTFVSQSRHRQDGVLPHLPVSMVEQRHQRIDTPRITQLGQRVHHYWQ